MEKKYTILAIETSCDETAAAVLSVANTQKLPKITTLSSVVKSQIALHSKFGGVVPEAAARAHVKNILPVVTKALSDAGSQLSAIDYIAITAGPGLVPSLIVGVEFAKALSFATGKPIIPVNHLLGHLYSPFGQIGKSAGLQTSFPMISLIVSGGHTMLVLMKNIKEYKVLGETVDDAVGEAFDKVAKLLGLPYPGGPEVSRLAKQAKHPVIFPRPMINAKNYNFSFSGLKTAVLYYIKDQGLKIKDATLRADICAGFQEAAVEVLAAKTLRAAKQYNARSISLSGGVAANETLRDALRSICKEQNLQFFVPVLGLCTDNAEMIGLAGAFMLYNGFKPKNPLKIKADPNLIL
ncbi:MAG: tRNA (adenosine(37)-N6)-threonylcarbamoyltransferase complex transferase subunit TsaD [Candidatus Doudnabacteria bacterium]|nr:tRNA (adenosine(37)-N6)-threonylcarbamoyltransferase complex transferase subunit TsaD [Candidatus Doudnabacteria bacterium]